MIELKNVEGGYNGLTKLHNISLKFEKGLITTIVGPNGCGKSTLLKLSSRLIAPYSGNIELEGNSINNIPLNHYAQKVSVLPQVRNIPSISVESMVLHGRFPYLKYPRRYSKKDREIVNDAINLTGLDGYQDKNMSELSGGERQKVYIAMVVAQDTDIVFLDEPTTYLDINHQLEIMQLVKVLNKQGKTIVMVLHDLNMALTNSHKIAVLNEGHLLKFDTPKNIFESRTLEQVFHVKIQKYESAEKDQYIFI